MNLPEKAPEMLVIEMGSNVCAFVTIVDDRICHIATTLSRWEGERVEGFIAWLEKNKLSFERGDEIRKRLAEERAEQKP